MKDKGSLSLKELPEYIKIITPVAANIMENILLNNE